MKVYLDNMRVPPDEWQLTQTVSDTICLLKTNKVTDLSLDHDLGDFDSKTGYDVLLWIEEAIMSRDFIPPASITVHTMNPVGRQRMLSSIDQIKRLMRQLEERRQKEMKEGKKNERERDKEDCANCR